MARQMVIDLDTGVDDAQAVMMAAADENTEILAVTCVAGNTALDNVCRNTLRVLKVCGKSQVPVYRGCDRPLLGKLVDASNHHGSDGLGNVPDVEPQAPPLDLVKPGHASSVLVQLAHDHPGEITLVALAPLTNIATALRLDPNFGKNLKECIIMGGNIEGRGNTKEHICAEFNFGVDPEAAYITLNELGCPIKILTWETCTTTKFPWDWYLNLNCETPKGYFHKKIEEYSTSRKIHFMKMDGYYSCDPAAMVVALDPSTVLESKTLFCSIELQGNWTRGQMVVDWRGYTERTPNVEIVKKLDSDKIKHHYEKMLM